MTSPPGGQCGGPPLHHTLESPNTRHPLNDIAPAAAAKTILEDAVVKRSCNTRLSNCPRTFLQDTLLKQSLRYTLGGEVRGSLAEPCWMTFLQDTLEDILQRDTLECAVTPLQEFLGVESRKTLYSDILSECS